MNVSARVRTWVDSPLLGGFVRTKTLERVLTITFATIYHITRQYKVMIFPMVNIRFSGIFAYTPAMFLSWRYNLVVIALYFFTTPEPIGGTIAFAAGIQVAYFGSRLLGKYKIVSLVFATFTANFIAIFIRASVLGLFPFEAAIGPAMLKATLLSVAMLIIAPQILKILESREIISFKER